MQPAQELPSLTVVKLKPKKEAPPKISTEVEVVEPPPTVLTNENVASADAEPADQMEAAAIEQQYQSGVELLKTGKGKAASRPCSSSRATGRNTRTPTTRSSTRRWG